MQNLRWYFILCCLPFIIAKISRYHKEKRNCTSGQNLYDLSHLPRKAYMNKHHEACSNRLRRIQTFISHFPPFLICSNFYIMI